jgi:hypothetical protein
LLLVLTATAAPIAYARVRVGPEFQVNVYTPGLPGYPAVATDAASGFVVVWESAGGDGSGKGVFAGW